MKSFKHVIISMALFLSLLSCNVTFDEELREYVDNIVARSPLDFSLSDSELIDDYDSINIGFFLGEYTADYTVTNNENIDIKLVVFEGINDDFTIDPFEAFTLKKGDSFTFNVIFNSARSELVQRISSEVQFSDEDGRIYTFYLWATTKRQPLSIYNSDRVEITELDLGALNDNTYTIILKNEGLDNLLVNSISIPSEINFSGDNSFSMAINEEREIHLEYVSTSESVDGQDMTFYTDDSRESEFSLALYAGGALPIVVLDSVDSVVSGDIDLGTYVTGDESVTYTFYLDNTSLFDIDLEVDIDSEKFVTGLGNSQLTVDENIEFQIVFAPTGEEFGTKTTELYLRDSISGRDVTINLTGVYSPI